MNVEKSMPEKGLAVNELIINMDGFSDFREDDEKYLQD
jgi:hypothetical protein